MSEELASPGSAHYIQSLENRIVRLEDNLTASQDALRSTTQQLEQLRSQLPNSSIISKSFVRRAFTVWGHYFVAQLMIIIPIYCIIFALGIGLSDF
jgi:hypothetical protein